MNLRPDEDKDFSKDADSEGNAEFELVERMALLEWLANSYKVQGWSNFIFLMIDGSWVVPENGYECSTVT